jgi:hypothetical protein
MIVIEAPVSTLTEVSTRVSGMSFKSATTYPYHPKNLITFIFPYWFGDYAKGTYPVDEKGEGK